MLLRAYKERKRGINSQVVWGGYSEQAVSMFSRLIELFDTGNTFTNEHRGIQQGYYQKHGVDYSSELLDEFITKYMLTDTVSAISDIPQFDCTMAIRRADYLIIRDGTAYMYDTFDYLDKVFTSSKFLSRLGGSEGFTLRITSDDEDWCREVLVPWIESKYSGLFSQIVVEHTDRVENFYQLLATSKVFVATNSTFTYWVGYILRLIDSSILTFVPDFNTVLIDSGRQIADVRGWDVVPVKPLYKN